MKGEESIHPLTDDDWCLDCGETRPCSCDAMYFEEADDERDVEEEELFG